MIFLEVVCHFIRKGMQRNQMRQAYSSKSEKDPVLQTKG
jgi:hypothetical protein